MHNEETKTARFVRFVERLWSRIAALSDDRISKHLFEHVRNLGLCALVFAAGHYELKNPISQGGRSIG